MLDLTQIGKHSPMFYNVDYSIPNNSNSVQ